MQQSWIDYLVIILYFSAVLTIGFYCARGEKSSVNYLLGGRKMPAMPKSMVNAKSFAESRA